MLVGYALAALVGLSLGMMGGGGSILTVPIFVYVLHYDPKLAIAMSLPVIGITSLIGAVGHWKAGNVNVKTALAFGVVAMCGAFAGARVARLLSGSVQLTLLAAVMLAAAVTMYRSSMTGAEKSAANASPRAMPVALLIPVALSVGVLTGVVGIGGGFLVVPALVLLARVPMKQAVGTSLLVIAMNSASGFAGYLGHVEVPWAFMLGFTGVAVCGILSGTYLVRFVSQSALKRAFAVFLVVMGTFILYRNRGVFQSSPATHAAARATAAHATAAHATAAHATAAHATATQAALRGALTDDRVAASTSVMI